MPIGKRPVAAQWLTTDWIHTSLEKQRSFYQLDNFLPASRINSVMTYVGKVIRESLTEQEMLDNLDEIANDFYSEVNWNISTIRATKKQIIQLSKYLKEKFYFHFWCGDDVIVAYPNKVFEFKHSNKKSWQPAVEYGLSLGIPKEQLDFPVG